MERVFRLSRKQQQFQGDLNHNQEDFHIELDCSPNSYAHLFWSNLRDASIDDIIECVLAIQDQQGCQQLDLIYKLTHGEEA